MQDELKPRDAGRKTIKTYAMPEYGYIIAAAKQGRVDGKIRRST